ncbi:MAG: DUF1016 domain-containing protein [Lachnospiraceae bacterium]|nr:DUF1016 domain-containing protein [Lachnospiraceae bacterium]
MRSQLTWTHYRLLLSVENEQARQWYMDEAIASAWSSRQLERQIKEYEPSPNFMCNHLPVFCVEVHGSYCVLQCTE